MDTKKISKISFEIKNGSEKHFKTFFEISHAMVFSVCKKMGLSNENVEEVVQDTYIQFWKQRDSIDENKGVMGLLKVIAKRLVIKKINSKERLLELKDNIVNLNKHRSVETPKLINRNLLSKNIEKLPSVQKQIVNLFYMEGLTTLEIAKYLGVTGRTVENNLYRARKNLKVIFNNENLTKNSFYDFIDE